MWSGIFQEQKIHGKMSFGNFFLFEIINSISSNKVAK